MDRMIFFKTTILLVLASFILATSGETMVRHFSFDEMIEKADIIFAGKVTDQQSRFSPKGKMILTDVTFHVERHIFMKDEYVSASEGVIVLTFAGGTVGDKNIRIPDVPTFKTGERYLIFARMDGKSYVSPVIGRFQGKFDIVTDEITGESYPLCSARKPVLEVSDKGLHLGPSVSRIRSGKMEKATDPLPSLRHNVAPQNADKSGKAKAFVSKHEREIPAKIMNLDELQNEIQKRIKLRKG